VTFAPLRPAAPGVCQVREVELRGQIFSGKRCPMQVGYTGISMGKIMGKMMIKVGVYPQKMQFEW
jgi:hypothetical protein